MNAPPFPIRQECPPGACTCRREQVLADPRADWRVLRLTRSEEKNLLARLEAIDTLEDLRHMQHKLYELLGVRLRVEAGPNEVRTVRGLIIRLEDQPGLCRKVAQSVPAAIRRALDNRPQIVYDLLNENSLFN